MAPFKKPILFHGLSERVDLKDWEFALIIAALKAYSDEARHRNLAPGVITYTRRLRSRLSGPFARLIKRTKRRHHEIWEQINGASDLTDFCS